MRLDFESTTITVSYMPCLSIARKIIYTGVLSGKMSGQASLRIRL